MNSDSLDFLLNPLTLVGAAALVGAVLTARDAWYAVWSRRWPSAAAAVVSSALHEVEGFPRGLKPYVRYKYQVGDREYESTRIRFGGIDNYSRHDALQELTIWNRVDGVRAFYDPRLPSRACLITGANRLTLAAPVILFVVSGGGLYFGLVG
jgi:hypothetical protein